jgi:sulfur-carrier protein adenylyltransferase/sulfurtransferase
MGIRDYFRPVLTLSATEVRELLNNKNPEDYNLVDVRQPKEYERGHLPGAKLIPLGDLEDRLDELDPKKPIVAY